MFSRVRGLASLDIPIPYSVCHLGVVSVPFSLLLSYGTSTGVGFIRYCSRGCEGRMFQRKTQHGHRPCLRRQVWNDLNTSMMGSSNQIPTEASGCPPLCDAFTVGLETTLVRQRYSLRAVSCERRDDHSDCVNRTGIKTGHRFLPKPLVAPT